METPLETPLESSRKTPPGTPPDSPAPSEPVPGLSSEAAPISGRVILVTGSAKNVGRSIALAFAAAGGAVAVHYRHSAREAMNVVRELGALGAPSRAFQADLEHSEEARRLVNEVTAHFGRLDTLVYNVGPFITTSFLRLREQEWDSVMTANLKSAWICAVEAAPWLRRSPGGGQLVTLGANSALVRTHSVYGLAKAALSHLTEALAIELAPEVTANCIAPGMVEGSEPDAATRDLVLSRTPLHRLVTAGEIGELCTLLCSPAFRSVTGRTLVVDGGRWIR